MPNRGKETTARGADMESVASGLETVAECEAYMAQLKGVLSEASADPPAGVTTREVEHRMMLLQSALDAVQARHDDLQQRERAAEAQRFISNFQRRIDAEEEAESKRTWTDKKRTDQVRAMRDEQVAFYQDRNNRTDVKAVQCREHNEKVQMETMVKATKNDGRREHNLEALMQERERKRKELHDREAAKQEYARKVRQRRERDLERQRAEATRKAQIHDQDAAAKLAAIRDAKRSKWEKKKSVSRAKTKVIFENGQAILETETKEHEDLVKDLEAKDKAQQQRYAVEQADRLYLLQQRAQYREMKQQKQQQNLDRIIDGRLKRGEEIVTDASKKRAKAEEARRRQATRFVEAGEALQKELEEHQKRSMQLAAERKNASLNKNYARWNHRAARIIAELQQSMGDDYCAGDLADSASFGDAASSRRRAAPLPSPSDFAV